MTSPTAIATEVFASECKVDVTPIKVVTHMNDPLTYSLGKLQQVNEVRANLAKQLSIKILDKHISKTLQESTIEETMDQRYELSMIVITQEDLATLVAHAYSQGHPK